MGLVLNTYTFLGCGLSEGGVAVHKLGVASQKLGVSLQNGTLKGQDVAIKMYLIEIWIRPSKHWTYPLSNRLGRHRYQEWA